MKIQVLTLNTNFHKHTQAIFQLKRFSTLASTRGAVEVPARVLQHRVPVRAENSGGSLAPHVEILVDPGGQREEDRKTTQVRGSRKPQCWFPCSRGDKVGLPRNLDVSRVKRLNSRRAGRRRPMRICLF